MTATGQQISITEILTRQGLTLEAEKSIDDIVSFKNPNADKLFKQLMNEAIAKKQSTIQITREEFMRVRKLKDKKEAYKQLKKAANDLYALSVPIKTIDENGKKAGKQRTRIFNSIYIPEHNGAQAGYIIMEFDKRFYDSLIKNSQVIYVPTKILQIPNNKPNSYFFACNLLINIKHFQAHFIKTESCGNFLSFIYMHFAIQQKRSAKHEACEKSADKVFAADPLANNQD